MTATAKYRWIDNRKVPFVPVEEWKWFGNAGHLCVADRCRFHLCTQVGEFLVSTVGEYVPDSATCEILAACRKIVLEGKGNARRVRWLRQNGYEKLGAGDGTYETMVFVAGEPCAIPDCHCGLPQISGIELHGEWYTTAGDATEGHYRQCLRWSAQGEPE